MPSIVDQVMEEVMRHQSYILDENWKPKAVSLLEAMASERHIVQLSVIHITDQLQVSTIFIGVNYAFGGRPPILWETAVFQDNENIFQMRYTSRRAAMNDHLDIVEMIKCHMRRAEMPDEIDRSMARAGCRCPLCRDLRAGGLVREESQFPDTDFVVSAMPHPSRSPQHKRGPIEERQQKEPLDDIQMELVRADIALLKAEAEKSGAMDKWRREQEKIERRRL